MSQLECVAAAKVFYPNLSSDLRQGSGGTCMKDLWGKMPLGCSVHISGSGRPSFKKSGDLGKSCIHPHYDLVCKSSGTCSIYRLEMLKMKKRDDYSI